MVFEFHNQSPYLKTAHSGMSKGPTTRKEKSDEKEYDIKLVGKICGWHTQIISYFFPCLKPCPLCVSP
jgi:hypothetical protein